MRGCETGGAATVGVVVVTVGNAVVNGFAGVKSTVVSAKPKTVLLTF